MRAKHCVLTHFSQRYPKMPTIALDRLASIPTVLAYDGMRIVVGGIARISRYLPAMSELSRELLGIAEDEG
jgi:ribonuclease Z